MAIMYVRSADQLVRDPSVNTLIGTYGITFWFHVYHEKFICMALERLGIVKFQSPFPMDTPACTIVFSFEFESKVISTNPFLSIAVQLFRRLDSSLFECLSSAIININYSCNAFVKFRGRFYTFVRIIYCWFHHGLIFERLPVFFNDDGKVS